MQVYKRKCRRRLRRKVEETEERARREELIRMASAASWDATSQLTLSSAPSRELPAKRSISSGTSRSCSGRRAGCGEMTDESATPRGVEVRLARKISFSSKRAKVNTGSEDER